MSESAAVVILTPMSLEYRAVREHLQDARQVWHPAGTAAEIGTVPGVPWPVAVVLTGEGNDEAGVLAERVSTWLQPQALFVVGVAGGLQDDIELGDVVVATWVYGYHSGKETSSGFAARPRAWRSHYVLEQAAKMADIKEAWADPRQAHPSVHFKPIAAGDVVLNSRTSPLAKQLHQNYSDAVAIETESAGTASAAHLNGSLPVLTIRGISDKADGLKHVSDAAGFQPVAAAHAAAFTTAILRQLAKVMDGETQALPGGSTGSQQPTATWRPLSEPLPAVWPPDLGVVPPRGTATVEVCLLPAGPLRPLAALQLVALPAELAEVGRTAGVFGAAQEITEIGSHAAVVVAAGAGLAVTRDSTRCGWLPLPQDMVGSVLDQEDVVARLTTLLSALTRVDVPQPREAGVAVAVTPSIPLAEGRVADLPRTTSRGRTSMTTLRIPAADALPWTRIAADPAGVAAELTARLLVDFRSRQGGRGDEPTRHH